MFDRDKWQEIFSTLRKNRLRTVLTAFGVSWGILMLVILIGLGNGLKNGVTGSFNDIATNSVFIWTRQTTIPYKGFPRGRPFWFRNDDRQALIDNIPEIQIVAPRIQGWGGQGSNNVIRGLHTGAFTIQGDYPEYNKIDPVDIFEGRHINPTDIDEKRKVAVIGPRAYDILFEPGEDPVGQNIRINGVYFTVVGRFKPLRDNEMGPDKNEMIIIPFTTLQKVYNYGDIVGHFAITSKEEFPVSLVEEKAKKVLAERHAIHPDDMDAFGGFNLEEEFRKMKGLFWAIDILLWFVGIGTLLAGAIGVSNIMLVIVKERTKEIGIRRAIGASPFTVMGQIMSESIILTMLAGLIGFSLGVWALYGINLGVEGAEDPGMFRNPEISLNVGIIAITIMIIAGALAGFIPARKAVSIKPIDALRYE
ncbi:MAG: ABC transporter permease [Bacteroidota bacterium]